MLNWFTRPPKKEQLKLLFSKYAPKELLELAGSSSVAELNQLSEGTVEFIFVLVGGSNPNETAHLLGAVTNVSERSGWMIQTILCNLVVIVHGTLPSAKPAVNRQALSNQLLTTFTSQVKLVHGSQLASFGSMGSAARVTYGVLLPSFTEVLSALNVLPFGQVGEFNG